MPGVRMGRGGDGGVVLALVSETPGAFRFRGSGLGNWQRARRTRAEAASNGWWFIRRSQVLLASQDRCFPEIVGRDARDPEQIVKFRSLVLENPFC